MESQTPLANPERSSADAGPVPAVERALDIIEFLSGRPVGSTLSELSLALELPKNAVFRIAHTLVARGYLARDEKTLRFRLTSRLMALGQPRRGDMSLVECALDAMRWLRDETRETVQLGVLAGAEGVIVEKSEGLHPVRIAVDVGLRFKLYNNAPGKVLLAFQPGGEREKLLAALELAPQTPRTITDLAELRRECQRVVAQGFGTDWAEADEGIHCVAAPVFFHHAQLAATVWVSAPSRRMHSGNHFPRSQNVSSGQQREFRGGFRNKCRRCPHRRE